MQNQNPLQNSNPLLSVKEKQHKTAEKYAAYIRGRRITLGVLVCASIILAFVSLRLGASELDWKTILKLLLRPDSSWDTSVIWQLR